MIDLLADIALALMVAAVAAYIAVAVSAEVVGWM